MDSTRYRSLEDIGGIAANAIPEGVTLEYKASDVVTKRQFPIICKAVTAFANSAGGQLVLGIKANGDQLSLDGGAAPPSYRDWIFKIVNSNTSPPVESFEVFEIMDGSRLYYVIDVPRSEKAPHQFNGLYYKRRGSHSEPMEHYEIEDVRNRPKGESSPLRIDIATRQEIMLLLHLRNDHLTESLTNLKFVIDANFKLDRSGIQSLTERGLRGLRPRAELYFHLDIANSILQGAKEPEMTVHAEYEVAGRRVQETFLFFLGDYNGSAIVRSDELDALKRLTDKVDKVVSELENMRRDNARLHRIMDGSGLRLSHRTLGALLDKGNKQNPAEYDWAGYQVILNCSQSDAHRLERIFHWRGSDGAKQEYEKLSPELRDKFEAAFEVSFDGK